MGGFNAEADKSRRDFFTVGTQVKSVLVILIGSTYVKWYVSIFPSLNAVTSLHMRDLRRES